MPKFDWTTIFAAIGAVTGVFSVWTAILKRRDEQARARQEQAARWSLTTQATNDSTARLATLAYSFVDGPRIHLLKISVVGPQKLLLAKMSNELINPGNVNGRRRKIPDGPETRDLFFGADLNGTLRRGNEGWTNHPHQDLEFFAYLPSRSFWCRSDRTRLCISVTFEERSAQRRAITHVVSSEQIPWTARKNVSSTE